MYINFGYNSDDIPEELPDAGGDRVEDGDPVGQLTHTQLRHMLPRSNLMVNIYMLVKLFNAK